MGVLTLSLRNPDDKAPAVTEPATITQIRYLLGMPDGDPGRRTSPARAAWRRAGERPGSGEATADVDRHPAGEPPRPRLGHRGPGWTVKA